MNELMSEPLSFIKRVYGEEAMVELGSAIGGRLPKGILLFLEGDLGAGKTTLTRGILKAFGHTGAVKSPTYTLVEPYVLNGSALYHFDFYRLTDPEELEFMGIRDYLEQGDYCLIEWPEKGDGILPDPDVRVRIEWVQDGGEIGREVKLHGLTEVGQQLVKLL